MGSEHQEFHGNEAGQVRVKKLGTDNFVKVDDLPEPSAEEQEANRILTQQMHEDATRVKPPIPKTP